MYFWGNKKMKVMKKYILLLTLFCPLLVLAQTENPKSLPSDSLSTTLHAEQLMAKDTLSVPLPEIGRASCRERV